MYKTANEYYKETFGCKVYKLSVDGGFTCPNRDGTLSTGGCIFCSQKGSGEFAQRGTDIKSQLERAKALVESKNKGGKYIAYFQSFTGTYAPLETLKTLFYEAVAPEYIVGLNVATRPDCLPNATIELLQALNQIKPVTVELGLQTANNKVGEYINRCYTTRDYQNALSRLTQAGIPVITHIIIGLPGDAPVETTRFAVACGTHGVKFHLLHVLKNTPLEQEYNQGKVIPLAKP